MEWSVAKGCDAGISGGVIDRDGDDPSKGNQLCEWPSAGVKQ